MSYRDVPSTDLVHVLRLRSLTEALRRESFNTNWAPAGTRGSDGFDRPEPPTLPSLRDRLHTLVHEIDESLSDDHIDSETVRDFERGNWTIGTEFEIWPPLDILRGLLVPVREVPSSIAITLKLFALIKISGSDDLLDRHLDQGIHYHYALPNGKHTTTLICWDTRWPGHGQTPVGVRGLFHELHALGAKSTVAKTWLWKDEKRISIREACERDQGNRAITEFRCASNDAEPVWPLDSVLTPRPAQQPRHRAKGVKR